MIYSKRGLNGDGVEIKYPKSAGFYKKNGTNKVQFLWHKVKGGNN